MRLVFEKYCCYCGKELNKNDTDFTKEHLVPKSKGGNDSLYNKKPCCKNCNSWRSNMPLSSFLRDVKWYLDNKQIRGKYTFYDYEIMIENIQYWDDFINSGIYKFKR